MVTFKSERHRKAGTGGATRIVMAAAAGALFLATPALAQQPAKKAPAAAPAKKAADAAKQSTSAWVKLCEKQKGDKKGNICLVHHERFHPTTGQPLISAAIRKVDGQKQDMLMIMVPLGRLISPGLLLKVDEQEPLKLQYAYCTALGCVAEMPANKDIVTKLKKGGQLSIGTVDIARKRIGFRIPLSGFTTALDGPPIDRKIYAQARKSMFDQIRARQVELVKRAKEAAAKKKSGGAAAPAAPKKQP